MSPERRTVLITGASSGIGAATATLLAASGYRVFGTSRRPTTETASGDTEMLALDVRSDTSVAACVETLLERVGRIDGLVNNAGFALHGESEGITPEQALQQLETNVVGVMRVTNAVLPAMRQEGRGRIVNVSSLAGLTAVPFLSMYCASKFALEGYSEVLRHELRDFGIWVTLIEPGFVKTPLIVAGETGAAPVAAYDRLRASALDRVRARTEAGIPPAQVAEAILRAIRARVPRLRYRVGREATWLPRVKAVAPPRMYEATTRRIFGLDAVEANLGGDRGGSE